MDGWMDGWMDIKGYVNKNLPGNVFFMHTQINNSWIDSNQILYIGSMNGFSYIFKTKFKLVQAFRKGEGGEIWLLPLTLAWASNTALLRSLQRFENVTYISDVFTEVGNVCGILYRKRCQITDYL